MISFQMPALQVIYHLLCSSSIRQSHLCKMRVQWLWILMNMHSSWGEVRTDLRTYYSKTVGILLSLSSPVLLTSILVLVKTSSMTQLKYLSVFYSTIFPFQLLPNSVNCPAASQLIKPNIYTLKVLSTVLPRCNPQPTAWLQVTTAPSWDLSIKGSSPGLPASSIPPHSLISNQQGK